MEGLVVVVPKHHLPKQLIPLQLEDSPAICNPEAFWTGAKGMPTKGIGKKTY